MANGTACNDGTFRTRPHTGQGGASVGARPVVRPASAHGHAGGSYNPPTPTRSNPAKPNGTACNDGTFCTRTDTCQGGACVGASPVVCSAADQCHAAGS